MPLTSPPTAPSQGDPSTFANRADALVAWHATNTAELDALQTDVSAKQALANASAVAAAAQAASATASALTATSAASAVAAPLWVSGTSYALGNLSTSPINYMTYRRIIAGAGTTDPSADSANWVQVWGSGVAGTIPIGGLAALPATWGNLVVGRMGEKYLRTGVVDDASAYPLAPAETVVSLTPTAALLALGTAANPATWMAYGNGVFVRSRHSSTAVDYSTDGLVWTATSAVFAYSNTSGVWFDSGLGRFMAVVGNGTIVSVYTSADGVVWNIAGSAASAAFTAQGMCFGNNTVVARVTGTASIYYSKGLGAIWTAQSTGLVSVQGISFGNGLFMALGATETNCATSPDGVTWTTKALGFTSGSTPLLHFANGKFWAVSASALYSSTDGITWVNAGVTSFAPVAGMFAIGHNGTQYVLAAGTGLWTSPNGTAWTSRTSPYKEATQPASLVCSASLWLLAAVQGTGTDSSVPAVSSNGISWVFAGVDQATAVAVNYRASDGAGRFAAGVSTLASSAFTSSDGLNWRHRPAAGLASASWRPLILNGLYLMLDTAVASTNLYTSADGVTYTSRTSISPGASSTWMCGAYGSANYLLMPGGAATTTARYSPTGVTWTSVTVPGLNYTGVAYGAGKFVAVSTTSGTAYCTGAPSGAWTLGSGLLSQTSGVVFVGARFLAWSSASRTAMTSVDGVNWTLQTLPNFGTWSNVCVAGNGVAYATTGTEVYASADGLTWTLDCTSVNAAMLLPTATGYVIYANPTGTLGISAKRQTRVANATASTSGPNRNYMRVA